MTDTIRVYDLAKELNMSNKDIIEKLDMKLGAKVKSHSSVISYSQAKKLKELLAEPKSVQAKKPKAFIVKKAKPKEEENQTVVEKQEIEAPKPVERVKLGKIEPVIEKPKERPRLGKVEFDRPQRPQRPQRQDRPDRPDRPDRFDRGDRQDRPQRPSNLGKTYINKDNNNRRDFKSGRPDNFKRPENQNAPKPTDANKDNRTDKKPIQRHIIPQEIYDSKGSVKKKGVKKKEHVYKSKDEEQERISLEKANAQKHKKRVHEQAVIEDIKTIVLNQPLTVGELSEKINKPSAEIVKFLMMQGILATVNQVIDVATAKKVCENFEIEVQDEDLEAFMEEELQKEEEAKELAAVDPKLLKRRAPVI